MKIHIIATVSLILAANAAAAGDSPRIEHVAPVASDIVGITIVARRVEYGRQVPYTRQAGDTAMDGEVHQWVTRDGKLLGTLVGRDADTLCTLDRVVGEKLDTAWADLPASYLVSSDDDSEYASPRQPAAVYRKSRPSDLGMVGPYVFDAPAEHILYLRLPVPLTVGKKYTISFENSPLSAENFTYDPAESRSEAVHVSHFGFRPDDTAKVAFLSCWMGTGGGLTYHAELPFAVLDNVTDEAMFEGVTVLSKAASQADEDALGRNYNRTDVYEMDFSALTKPGTYRVCVKSIGCSYPFEIAEDVWRKAFYVSARGFYHQRSGIELGPPYTTFKRPRCFHPDDGVKIYASTAPLMDTGNGLNSNDTNFGNLVKGKTDEIVPNAWGGYMDAGDWDRRVQHFKATLLLLELAELFPDYFADLNLSIPESNNELPDIVDEALFNLDCYRQMQLPDGGIRGGIESAEHPRRGEGSWQESLDIMAYAPGVFSSCFYAGAAARAAHWLESRNPEKAEQYRESALRAMRWAEADLPRAEKENISGKHPAVRDARNYAAAELFRLTGDERWHNIFLATTMFKDEAAAVPRPWDSLDQRDSAWVYVRTNRPGLDERVKENCRKALLDEADERVAGIAKAGFHWAKHPYAPALYGAFSSPEECTTVVRAHVLTGDQKYLRALVLASQTGAGANPLNICYTTALGHAAPKHALHIDSRILHQPAPPGLTLAGPMDWKHEIAKQFSWARDMVAPHLFPPIEEWPAIESFWDVFWNPLSCEYTVHKPMAGNAYVWGYLAARRCQ
jgi:endoglucanase